VEYVVEDIRKLAHAASLATWIASSTVAGSARRVTPKLGPAASLASSRMLPTFPGVAYARRAMPKSVRDASLASGQTILAAAYAVWVMLKSVHVASHASRHTLPISAVASASVDTLR